MDYVGETMINKIDYFLRDLFENKMLVSSSKWWIIECETASFGLLM